MKQSISPFHLGHGHVVAAKRNTFWPHLGGLAALLVVVFDGGEVSLLYRLRAERYFWAGFSFSIGVLCFNVHLVGGFRLEAFKDVGTLRVVPKKLSISFFRPKDHIVLHSVAKGLRRLPLKNRPGGVHI